MAITHLRYRPSLVNQTRKSLENVKFSGLYFLLVTQFFGGVLRNLLSAISEKYIREGARRIGSSRFTEDLETVAFVNPGGTIVSVVLNRTESDISFAFRLRGKLIECTAGSHSIATYTIE